MTRHQNRDGRSDGHPVASGFRASVLMSLRPDDFTTTPVSSAVDNLRQLLPGYLTHQVLGTTARHLLAKLDQYQGWLDEGRLHSEGLQIDVLGQTHGSLAGALAPEYKQVIVASQTAIRLLLGRKKYDVVGVEGMDIDPVTFSGLRRTIQLEAMRHGGTLSKARARQFTNYDLDAWGALQHLKEYPQAFLIGQDDATANRFHQAVLFTDFPKMVTPEEFGRVNFLASYLRSDIAVAKIVKKLRLRRKKKGAMVIGYEHRSRVQRLLAYWHIISDIYQATPHSPEFDPDPNL